MAKEWDGEAGEIAMLIIAYERYSGGEDYIDTRVAIDRNDILVGYIRVNVTDFTGDGVLCVLLGIYGLVGLILSSSQPIKHRFDLEG